MWLLKTEPSSYSYDDLERDRGTAWDGVKNAAALKNMREMRPGDEALVYHTGAEKAVIGVARVTSEPYPDPEQDDARLVVVDVAPSKRLARPVPLAELKALQAFEGSALVRQGRLSVVRLNAPQWRAVTSRSESAP